jgi:hypothetical protein
MKNPIPIPLLITGTALLLGAPHLWVGVYLGAASAVQVLRTFKSHAEGKTWKMK